MSYLALRRLEPAALVIVAALLGAGATTIAYATHPLVPLALALAAALVVLSVSRPMIVLYAAMALVPLELFSARVAGAGLTPAEAAFALSGLGWAASRVVRGELPYVPSPLGRPLLLLVLALVPGIAIVPEPFDVGKVLLIWATFFLAFQMIVAEGSLQTVKNLLFLLGVSAAVVGVIAVVQSGGRPPELRGFGDIATGRATGSFAHPNTLATFEALALPGALALALKGPARMRPVALVSLGVIFAGLALSLSRGGLLAVAGAMAMMLIWGPFRRTVIAACLIVLVLAIAGGNPLGDVQQVELLTSRLQSISYSAAGVDPRFRVWEGTPEIIADHPIFGTGEKSFPRTAQQYGLFVLGRRTSTYEHAHNIPLTIGAELGLIGLAALGWLVVALIRALVRGYRRSAPEDRGLVLALAAAFLALALQGLVDYTLRSAVIVAVVFVLVACVAVLSDSPRAETVSK
jgi:O-antigen ligase